MSSTSKPSKAKPTKTKPARRTQAERRAETQAAVLNSACKLFGQQGYDNTSLEDIARDCDVTIRPIYHYFDNKLNLFKAVVEHTESKILQTYNTEEQVTSIRNLLLQRWRAFLDLCGDPTFCQIVLIDSPKVLGIDHWSASIVSNQAQQLIAEHFTNLQAFKAQLATRMIMGALTEAGLLIATADKPKQARKQADELVTDILNKLLPDT